MYLPQISTAHYPGPESRRSNRKCFITSFAFGRRVCRPLFNRSSGGRLSNKALFLTRFASTVFSAYVYCFLHNNNVQSDRRIAVTRVQSKREILYYRKLTDIDANENIFYTIFFVHLLQYKKKKMWSTLIQYFSK